jgi:hypothetical protein
VNGRGEGRGRLTARVAASVHRFTEVSRWLGHRSIEITHQIYGHLVPASWDRARTVLDNARKAGRHQPPPEIAC